MKLKNLFASCSSSSRSRKLRQQHEQMGQRGVGGCGVGVSDVDMIRPAKRDLLTSQGIGHYGCHPRSPAHQGNYEPNGSSLDGEGRDDGYRLPSHRPVSTYENFNGREEPIGANEERYFAEMTLAPTGSDKWRNKRKLDAPSKKSRQNNGHYLRNGHEPLTTKLSGEGSSGYSSSGSPQELIISNGKFGRSRFYVGEERSHHPPTDYNDFPASRFESGAKRNSRLVESGLKVGDRVVWIREPQETNESGLVKWLGSIGNEDIAGIEFDNCLGLGTGWYRNRQLFECAPYRGGLVAVAGLLLEEDFIGHPLYHFNGDSNSSSCHISTESPSPTSSSGSNGSVDIGDNRFRNQVVPYEIRRGEGDVRGQRHLSELQNPRLVGEGAETGRRKFYAPPFFEENCDNCEQGYLKEHYTPYDGSLYPKEYKEDFIRGCEGNLNSEEQGHSTKAFGISKKKQRLKMPVFLNVESPLREEDADKMNGTRKGIQGHRNSCYLDATLFSMFSFSSVFDSILLTNYEAHSNFVEGQEDDLRFAIDVQKVLRDEIVNPLRKDLYCNADNVMKLRQMMSHLDDKLTSEEMDPQEFLQLLFKKVLNLNDFMPLSSGHSDFFHQVLVQPSEEDKGKIPLVQKLLEMSLTMQDLKLKEVPTPALILQMPRSGNRYKMYNGILPNLTIDITDLMENAPRTCIICGGLATQECLNCYGAFMSDNNYDSGPPNGCGMECTSFCHTCFQMSHSKKGKEGHLTSVTQIKYSPDILQYFAMQDTSSSSRGLNGNRSLYRPVMDSKSITTNRPIPRVTMDLFAVICIETSHFVSFVKCGTDRKAPWVFFDSMADRQENINGMGHNIPQVKILPEMGRWLDELERNPSQAEKKLNMMTPELKRLLSDPYMCLYYSPETCMYS